MKLYVDELPKSCGDCVFCKQTEYYYYCDKLHTKLGYIDKDKDCPLQSLADYTKQVRKELCEEIGEQLGLRFDGKWQVVCDGCMTGDKTIMAVLDQIQGEKNAETK
jgi:hypothetical protein